jgi:DNA topoisomerase-1
VKTFEASPVTSQPIKLLNGRYGMYLTDGQTNATLPKDVPEEGLTFELAVRLLAERAAAGPSKKKAGRGRAGAAPKSAAKKTAKKAAPKKSAAKKGGAKRATKKSAVEGAAGDDVPFDVD